MILSYVLILPILQLQQVIQIRSHIEYLIQTLLYSGTHSAVKIDAKSSHNCGF